MRERALSRYKSIVDQYNIIRSFESYNLIMIMWFSYKQAAERKRERERESERKRDRQTDRQNRERDGDIE